jgi:hypothetical protein
MTLTNGSQPREPSSIKRVAAYVAGVGEGNRFTKLELFSAVPGVAQADRRMRDLREMGWEIAHYKVNRNLAADEYLVVKLGIRIDLGASRPPARRTITGAKRRRILERDGMSCQVCGVHAGEPLPHDPARNAVLSVGHIIPVDRGGTDDDSNLRAECQIDNDATRNNSVDPPTRAAVLTRIERAGSLAKKMTIFGWMQAGRRTISDLEAIFNDWARLSMEDRLWVQTQVGAQVTRDDRGQAT